MTQTIAAALAHGEGVLCQALGVSQKLDVAWMLSDVLQKDRAFLYTYPERVLDEVQWRRYRAMLAKRSVVSL